MHINLNGMCDIFFNVILAVVFPQAQILCARGVMVIIVGNVYSKQVQILDEADGISHSTNNVGNGMNPIILPPAMGK